jgi:hypothetical protein
MKSSIMLAAMATAAFAIPANASAPQPTVASVEQFAKCAIAHYEGAELLATQPGSAEEQEVLSEYNRLGCKAPATGAGILRGAVAEQLFQADFGSIGSRARRDNIEVFTVDMSELEELSDEAKKRIDYVAFGTCVAASDPQASSSVLSTSVESAEERAKLTQLVPQFASCLTEGEKFTFSRADLRSALAEGAYRLALAQTLSENVVVTGTRDPSKTVQCKLQDVAGTRIRRNICRTEAQWQEQDRAKEYSAEEIKRRAHEFQEIQTTIETRSRFPSGA